MVRRSKKIALSGILTAVAVIFMYIGALFQVLDLSSAALGSIVILIALIEVGKGYALGIFASSSVLALLLLPSKAPALIFVAFSGYYPILKVYLNMIKPKALSYLARFAVFNGALFLILFAGSRLFGVDVLAEYSGSRMLTAAFLTMCEVTFGLYDFALERMVFFYTVKLKNRFRRN